MSIFWENMVNECFGTIEYKVDLDRKQVRMFQRAYDTLNK